MSPSLGGGRCGSLCDLPELPSHPLAHNVYDNAVAAVYLVKRGHLKAAQQILSIFLKLLYPSDGVACKSALIGKASGRKVSLLAGSYTSEPVQACVYGGTGVQSNGVYAGNNAWVGLAFAHYASATNSTCHATVARDILGVLFENKCSDGLQGVMGVYGPTGSPTYRSVEHNIDIYALATILGDKTIQDFIATFIRNNYLYDKRAYGPGTRGSSRCDVSTNLHPIPLDTQVWNFLAGADLDQERSGTSLQFAFDEMAEENVDFVSNTTLSGFRFSNAANGVQWEVTTSAAMSLILYKQSFNNDRLPWLQTKLDDVRNSVRYLLSMYGVVPGSVLGGNNDAYNVWKNGKVKNFPYPGGSPSGFGWTYLRYGHLASTAWSGLLLLMQFDEESKVNLDANPYALSSSGIPPFGSDNENLQCIP